MTIRKSGGYRKLASFQTSTIIYDATFWFCEKYLDSRSRTVDQMIQAARSGRQNIAEGSLAPATSSQTELRLVNVARSSLEELLLDYEDYLRHRHLEQWQPDDASASAVRCVPRDFRESQSKSTTNGRASVTTDMIDLSDRQRWALYSKWLDHQDPVIRANALICIIHQCNYLLDLQISALESQFVQEGGYTEQLAAARMEHRTQQPDAATSQCTSSGAATSSAAPLATQSSPDCPQCGKPMSIRTAKQGQFVGQQFWGCSAYPDCKSTIAV